MQSTYKISSIIFGALILAISSSAQGANLDILPKKVQSIFKKHNLPHNSLSLYFKEIGAQQPLLVLHEDFPRNPASSIKIITTYAALELLSPAYTWQTNFYLDGTLSNGTLDGNLIMRGGGDPFLVKEAFWHILFTLQAKGLKHIKGDFLIDDEEFEDETGSPSNFDKRPYRVYNVFPDAALVNFQAHQFHFAPQKNVLHIYADPPAATMKINNKVKLSKGRCRGKYKKIKHRVSKQGQDVVVTFSGNYPRSCGHQQLLRTMIQNDQYIYGVFKSLWEGMGGTISGKLGKTKINEEKPFYVATSKPLGEIVAHINKYSNNVMARQLLLTIGKEKLKSEDQEGKGSKILGRQAIQEWLLSVDIPAPELVLDNGSGLSRKTRVSAATMGKLLEHAYFSSYQPEFMASLPMLGIDGTLRKRLKGSIPAGKIRMKTGFLNGVRAMAGYVRSQSDKNYVVVMLQNHPGIQNGVGTQIQDGVLKWLYKK